MITVVWRSQLPPDESVAVARLLTVAGTHDAEAGFSTAEADGIFSGMRCALVRLAAGDSEKERLVGFLRLTPGPEHRAGGQLVVRPGYRSRGIATLLVERTRAAGWPVPQATQLFCWAHGDHPAAARMARRFGADVHRRVWHLSRGDAVCTLDADDGPAITAARRDGFVHDRTDVEYRLAI
jgi:mycothiol synthase